MRESMISSGAGAIGLQLSERRGEKPFIRLRCCVVNGVQKSSAEMTGHRGKRSPDDIRTPQNYETSMAKKGHPGEIKRAASGPTPHRAPACQETAVLERCRASDRRESCTLARRGRRH